MLIESMVVHVSFTEVSRYYWCFPFCISFLLNWAPAFCQRSYLINPSNVHVGYISILANNIINTTAITKKINPVDIPSNKLELTDDGEYYFNELVSECQKYQDQCTFVFGKMPKVNDVAGAKEFISSEAMFNTIEERLEGTNIKYKNFTRYITEIGLDPKEDFKDEDHLNHLGALKFTRYFAKYIKDELKINIKEKSKEAISSFDECYEKTKDYLSKIEKKLNDW